MSLDFSGVTEAWSDVRNDNTADNWMVIKFDEQNKNQAVLVGKGSGGYDEFMSTIAQPDCVFFGAFRVVAVDDDSRRMKFVFVSWIGDKVSPLKRARVSTLKSGVEIFFKGFHVEFTINHAEDMSKEDIEKKLNTSTGAHKPKHYEF